MHFTNNSNFFIHEVPDAAFTIIRDAAGKVVALELIQGGNKLRLLKINPGP